MARTRSTASSSTTCVYAPAETPLHARRRAPPAATTIGGLEMLSRRPSGSSRSGRAAAAGRALSRRDRGGVSEQIDEADNVRRVRGAGAARHVRAGRQGDHGGPADAGLRVPEDRRALRLRVPVRERRRRRAGRALFVPRQGSVPRPAARDGNGPSIDRAGVTTETDEPFVAVDAAADGGVPGAVRARACRASPAAPSASSATTPRRSSSRRSQQAWQQAAIAGRSRRRRPEDDAGFMLFDTVLAFDHVKHRILIIANARVTGRRGPGGALPVRLRQDPVPRARARAQPVAAGRRRGGRRREVRSNQTRETFEGGRAHDQGAHRRRRHLPGGAVAALRDRRHRRSVHGLSRAAARQSVAVHVFHPHGRARDRRLVAGDAGAGRRAARRDASDRRHAAARRATRRRICGWPRS